MNKAGTTKVIGAGTAKRSTLQFHSHATLAFVARPDKNAASPQARWKKTAEFNTIPCKRELRRWPKRAGSI